jgi:pSer/pThr/pTyr-binding forkhead associated (FHA) protein
MNENITQTNIGIPILNPDTNPNDFYVATDKDREIVSGLEKGTALLVSFSINLENARFLLDTESITIGRSNKSDIFLDDYTVSRNHATINKTDGKFVIEDLNSLNGTYVNSILISEAELSNNDIIQIGKYKFVFLKSGK